MYKIQNNKRLIKIFYTSYLKDRYGNITGRFIWTGMSNSFAENLDAQQKIKQNLGEHIKYVSETTILPLPNFLRHAYKIV